MDAWCCFGALFVCRKERDKENKTAMGGSIDECLESRFRMYLKREKQFVKEVAKRHTKPVSHTKTCMSMMACRLV